MFSFNEISLRNEFIKVISDGFALWYDFLKTEVSVLDSEPQEVSFPCCIVSIVNPTSNTRYDDSEGSFKIIRLSLECDLYSQELDDIKLNDSIIVLSEILIQTILGKYPTLVVSRNSNVPYRTDTKRRVIDFSFTYDTKNKIIYSN